MLSMTYSLKFQHCNDEMTENFTLCSLLRLLVIGATVVMVAEVLLVYLSGSQFPFVRYDVVDRLLTDNSTRPRWIRS